MKATELAESSFIISLGSLRYANVYRRESGSLQLTKATVLAESSFIFWLGSLATTMSTDMSQVGVALFLSF